MKKLMIYFCLYNFLQKFVLCCNPRNFYITLGDVFSLKIQTDNDLLKVGFITPTICKNTPVLEIEGMQNKVEFVLVDFYIGKFYQANDSKFYKRYLYIAKIYELKNKEQFKYKVIIPEQTDKKYEFFYKSKILLHQQTGSADIVVFGDHPLTERGLLLNAALEKEEKMDALFILGDVAYDIHDDFGQKGDLYFDKLQPIITKVPTIIIHGNHDMIDNGKLLGFRFYLPGCEYTYENHRFQIEIANSIFTFINPDKYFNNDVNQKRRFIKNITQNTIKEEKQISNIQFKFLLSHRPFFCFSNTNKESCNRWNGFIWDDLLKLVSDRQFDYHFTGHVHLYQRFNNHILHTPDHISSTQFDQANLDFETVIIGSGGQLEDLPAFTNQIQKIKPLANIPNALGYLRLSLINFSKVQGEFIALQDQHVNPYYNFNDKFEKTKI